MIAPKYRIATIKDMLAIPADARERFAAELPDILRTMDQMAEAMPALADQAHAKMPRILRWLITPEKLEKVLLRQMGTRSVWIDDDKRTGTFSVRLTEKHDPYFTRSETMEAGDPA